jgi:hypothetical protein
MPKVALADTLHDWEILLRAAAKHRDQKKMYVHLDKLQAALDRLRELQALRESLLAQSQRATQEMAEACEEGKVASIEVRSLLRAILGPQSEALVEYNIRPRRKRGPRKKRAPEPAPSV